MDDQEAKKILKMAHAIHGDLRHIFTAVADKTGHHYNTVACTILQNCLATTLCDILVTNGIELSSGDHIKIQQALISAIDNIFRMYDPDYVTPKKLLIEKDWEEEEEEDD